jgi:hypothetical protein
MSKRMTSIVAALLVLISGGLALSVRGQAEVTEEKAVAAIQYKVVQVPQVMTQAQLQAVLTTQGNAGYRLILPFAVGTGPIPNQTVLVFSKP